ncbi:MAG TPA: type II secretion system F family protein [Archaeoglobus profundus]|nr:type II secretion system F family protein [Archaeoglobus profundus]
MQYYVIEAIDSQGRKVKKIYRATDEHEVYNYINFFNLIPLKISKKSKIVSIIYDFLYRRRVKRKDLIELFETLHLIIRSGVPINLGLLDLAEEADNKVLKNILYDIVFKIGIGYTIYDAFKKYSNIFGDLTVYLIKIGEETGNLEKIFKDIHDHIKYIDDIANKVKQALIYPVLTITTISVALIFWLTYVLPKIVELFTSLNLELPLLTKIVLVISSFIKEYFILGVFLILSVPIVLYITVKNNAKLKGKFDRLIFKIPVIGELIYMFYMAFISEYLRLMFTTGVSLHNSFEMLYESLNNLYLKDAIQKTWYFIERGEQIHEGMKRTGAFPAIMIRMISFGEETGELSEQLDFLVGYFRSRLIYITENITKALEPIVLLIVGIFMSIVMMSIFMPVYDLISKVGKML